MKFSIVTVCYNAAKELEATMLSVLEQDYPNIEYIVIDGGSTDGTVDIIRKYSNRLAYWVSEPDKGIYDAMNKALTHCTGQYVNFMNAGDSFASPNVLSQIAALNSSANIIYGQTLRATQGGKQLCLKEDTNLSRMKFRGVICHQSAFISTDYHKSHPYDTSLKIMADFKFFRHAYLRDKLKFEHVQFPISIYEAENGISTNRQLLNSDLKRIISPINFYLLSIYRLIRHCQY